MEIYGLKNCDKCRRAGRALNLSKIIDIKNEPIPEQLLQAAFLTFGGQLINRSSTTWRGLSDIEKGYAPLALLKKYPKLMKRPLIKTAEGQLFIGWTEDVRSALIRANQEHKS